MEDYESVKLAIQGFCSYRFMDDLSSLIMLESLREYGFTYGAVLSFQVKSGELGGLFYGFEHSERWRSATHANGERMREKINGGQLWANY